MEGTTEMVVGFVTSEVYPVGLGNADCVIMWYQMVCAGIVLIESAFVMVVNAFTLIAVIRYKMVRRSASNLCIASLTFIDFICGLSAFGFKLQILLAGFDHKSEYLSYLGWISAILGSWIFFASFLMAIFIGIDRITAIWQIFYNKRLVTIRNMGAAIFFGALIITSCILFPVIRNFILLSKSQKSSILQDPMLVYPETYRRYFIVPFACLLMLASVLLNAFIYKGYYRFKLAFESLTPNQRRDMRVSKTAFTIVGLLIVCWGPTSLFGVLSRPNSDWSPDVITAFSLAYEVVFVLILVPCWMNTFIYALQQPPYKKAYLALLQCKKNNKVHISS